MAVSGKSFPLAEVITGFIVVGILWVFGLPQVQNWWFLLNVERDIQTVVGKLNLAKDTAMETRHNIRITFDAADQTYKLHEDINANGEEDEGEHVEIFALGKNIRYGTNASFHIKDIWRSEEPLGDNPIQLMGGSRTIVFTSQGKASHNGAIYLMPIGDEGATTQRMRAIRILKVTGDVRVMRYVGREDFPWQ